MSGGQESAARVEDMLGLSPEHQRVSQGAESPRQPTARDGRPPLGPEPGRV